MLKSHPDGTEDSAAPIRKMPIEKVATLSVAPRDFTLNGPTVVSSVEVVRVAAQASANKQIL